MVGRPASAWQRAFPGGSGVTGCCRPDDVAQVTGQSACRARGVLGQIEEVVQIRDQHSQDCTGQARDLAPLVVRMRRLTGVGNVATFPSPVGPRNSRFARAQRFRPKAPGIVGPIRHAWKVRPHLCSRITQSARPDRLTVWHGNKSIEKLMEYGGRSGRDGFIRIEIRAYLQRSAG